MVDKEYQAEWIVRAQKIAHLGIWDQDPVSNKLWWSDETFKIIGLEPQSVAPSFELFLQSVHPDDRNDIIRQTDLSLKSDDNPYNIEYRIILPDESERIIHEEALIERDAKGSPTKITGIIQDITERRRAEEALQLKEEQLRRSQKMESVGILAGGIAHEFNNLLYIISGTAELLLLDARPEDQENLEGIFGATQRGADLVKKLLAFSRKSDYNLYVTSLNAEIRKVMSMLDRVIPRMIDVELDLAENLLSIKSDIGQIEQIVMNLCLNARDAMPEGGMLYIKTENGVIDESFLDKHPGAKSLKTGSCVIMSIADTGCGMDKKTMENIFDPFFTTKDIGKGTGLGLSVIYGIIEGHDEYVLCESEPGSGTTFNIYFPAAEDVQA